MVGNKRAATARNLVCSVTLAMALRDGEQHALVFENWSWQSERVCIDGTKIRLELGIIELTFVFRATRVRQKVQ